jgi:hypothetical protein
MGGVRRVGYCISVGSSSFFSQADHTCALQWVHLLSEQSVAADDVLLWLRTKKGVTVENPRGWANRWLMGPRLVVPPEYAIDTFCQSDDSSGGEISWSDSFLEKIWMRLCGSSLSTSSAES